VFGHLCPAVNWLTSGHNHLSIRTPEHLNT
jgi:hypothetical protein